MSDRKQRDQLLAEFITEEELADAIEKTIRTLRAWRAERIGPPYTRMGREILYRREAFVDWLKSQEQKPVRSRRAA